MLYRKVILGKKGTPTSRYNKTGVTNDPLGQTHNLTSSDHFVYLKMVLFCVIWTSVQDDMCENSDHKRPCLWVGHVDHFCTCAYVLQRLSVRKKLLLSGRLSFGLVHSSRALIFKHKIRCCM